MLIVTSLTYQAGATPLNDAIRRYDVQAVRNFLELDTKGELLLSELPETKETALHVVVSGFSEHPTQQALEIIELLLQTAVLRFTVKGGRLSVPEALFLRETGNKPLAFSAVNTLLLKRDAKGRTALHLAVDFNDRADSDNDYRLRKALVKILLNYNTQQGVFELLMQKDIEGYTPLHIAVAVGDLEMVALLLVHCANVGLDVLTQKEIDGGTPLHTAVAVGDQGMVALLLTHCANPDVLIMQKDIYGHTPLHMAVGIGNKDIVVLLLPYCANPDILTQKDIYGHTPLHTAMGIESVEMVDLLLSNCINADILIEKGYAANATLVRAIFIGNVKIIDLLLPHTNPDLFMQQQNKKLKFWTKIKKTLFRGVILCLMIHAPFHSKIDLLQYRMWWLSRGWNSEL